MQVGIFDWIDRRPGPLTQIYEERLKFVETADRAGFYCYHLAEHHFAPISTVPSPGIFLAALAQRTRRIHFGPLCYLLPLYPPARLIEEICMLDNLSGGRLEVGIGRGVSPFELGFAGVDPAKSKAMYEEALDTIVAGLTHETLNHEGPYYRYKNVPMQLRPLQQPYPPFWYPSHSPESIAAVAARGINVITVGPDRRLHELADMYREQWDKHRHAAGRLNTQLTTPFFGATKQVFLADTDAEAERIARPAYEDWRKNITWLFHRELGPNLPLQAGGMFGDYDSAVGGGGGLLVGSPAKVREHLQRTAAESGVNYLMCSFHWGSLTHAEALHSLELFASEILPDL
ncbi:MAG TPA: LLM class flavin-dependent oxidoreductase [Candidatus Binataceae bacterium]|nr:LLM class flavin-dependent oxidoreductase [Candidatus Binataceae bacterium]